MIEVIFGKGLVFVNHDTESSGIKNHESVGKILIDAA